MQASLNHPNQIRAACLAWCWNESSFILTAYFKFYACYRADFEHCSQQVPAGPPCQRQKYRAHLPRPLLAFSPSGRPSFRPFRESKPRAGRCSSAHLAGFCSSRPTVSSARVPARSNVAATEQAGGAAPEQLQEKQCRCDRASGRSCAGAASSRRWTWTRGGGGRDSALQKTRRAAAGWEVVVAQAQHPSPVPDTRLGRIPSQLIQGLFSGGSSVQVEAVREFTKLLSIEKPLIKEVVSSGLVHGFIQLLAREDCPELQFEVVRILTNIALGAAENTMVVVSNGVMPIFVKLLRSPSEDVREQAVWALGNMVGNSGICRDLVLEHGALFPVLQQLCGHAKLSMLQKASWALSNICHGFSQPNFEHVKPILLVLRQLIHSQDDEVLSNACRALSYLSDGSSDNIQAVFDAGAYPQLVELLRHSSPSVLILVLHVICNIAGRGDVQIQCIIDHQTLPCLLNLLMTNQNKGIKFEVCRIISNIMVGNKEQIQSVINGDMIGPLVHLMQTAEFGVRYEAAWAIANAASFGTHDQKKYLVSQDCIKAFCALLSYSDTRILTICLEGLENILKVGEAEKSPWGCNVNMYAQMIEDAGWLDKIENLQSHDNSVIVEKAACLLESYWSKEDNAMPMPWESWDDPSVWLMDDHTYDFSFFAPPGDSGFG